MAVMMVMEGSFSAPGLLIITPSCSTPQKPTGLPRCRQVDLSQNRPSLSWYRKGEAVRVDGQGDLAVSGLVDGPDG